MAVSDDSNVPTRPADYAALLAARSRLPLHPPAGHRDWYRKVLDGYGENSLLEQYGNGAGMAEIAMHVGVPVLALQEYMDDLNPKRMKAAKKARASVLMEMARAASEYVSSNPAEAASQRVLVETLKFEASMLDEGLQPAKKADPPPATVNIVFDMGDDTRKPTVTAEQDRSPLPAPRLDISALFPLEDCSMMDDSGTLTMLEKEESET